MNRIADYGLDRELWRGNHGIFWLASPPTRLGLEDPSVVVKVLDQHASDDDFRRMVNELKVFAAVASPFLVELLDAGHDDGRLFYSCRFLPDGSLARPSAPIGRKVVVQAVADAARAADALHDAGVAHRDIKPSNVWLTNGRGRLADLGLAQVLNPGQTVTGVGPIGAVEFVAPETILGEPADRASDVWALAATLHLALTGTSIFPDLTNGSLLDALRHVMDREPVIDPSLEASIAGIVGRCLRRSPEDRPATAAELADALERELATVEDTDVR